MNWLLDRFLRHRLDVETEREIVRLRAGSALKSRRKAARLLSGFAAIPGPKAELGVTPWGETATISPEDLIRGYGLITGATGAGKTRFALLLVRFLLTMAPSAGASFSILDPKGELFFGTLFLLKKRLRYLRTADPLAYEILRDRVVIYDFSSRDPVGPYNILARWPDVEADYFADNRADLLLDLLEGSSDGISLVGASVLKKLILLLSEFHLPITRIGDVLREEGFRRGLIERTSDPGVRSYFNTQFPVVAGPTLQAIDRRIEALFSSDAVRRSITGPTAPDFRALQDEGRIVLVNCFGDTITRNVRRLLQGLVLSDIRQSVFSRRKRDLCHLWIADEAQNFFTNQTLRENMADLLTMSRSFGSFFLLLTQNLSAAVQDRRILNILYTNIRWSFSMRGEPSDCEFLKNALPVTGRMAKPRSDPFAQRSFYSPNEERNLRLAAIANLPDREGYLWFKTRTEEAFRIRTAHLEVPGQIRLRTEIGQLLGDPNFGHRISRHAYERILREGNGKSRRNDGNRHRLISRGSTGGGAGERKTEGPGFVDPGESRLPHPMDCRVGRRLGLLGGFLHTAPDLLQLRGGDLTGGPLEV